MIIDVLIVKMNLLKGSFDVKFWVVICSLLIFGFICKKLQEKVALSQTPFDKTEIDLGGSRKKTGRGSA